MVLNKVIVHYETCCYAKLDFSDFNKEKFVKGFSNLCVEFLHDSNTSLNSKFGMFIETVSEYVDDHASSPFRKINKNDLKLPSKPWVN